MRLYFPTTLTILHDRRQRWTFVSVIYSDRRSASSAARRNKHTVGRPAATFMCFELSKTHVVAKTASGTEKSYNLEILPDNTIVPCGPDGPILGYPDYPYSIAIRTD